MRHFQNGRAAPLLHSLIAAFALTVALPATAQDRPAIPQDQDVMYDTQNCVGVAGEPLPSESNAAPYIENILRDMAALPFIQERLDAFEQSGARFCARDGNMSPAVIMVPAYGANPPQMHINVSPNLAHITPDTKRDELVYGILHGMEGHDLYTEGWDSYLERLPLEDKVAAEIWAASVAAGDILMAAKQLDAAGITSNLYDIAIQNLERGDIFFDSLQNIRAAFDAVYTPETLHNDDARLAVYDAMTQAIVQDVENRNVIAQAVFERAQSRYADTLEPAYHGLTSLSPATFLEHANLNAVSSLPVLSDPSYQANLRASLSPFVINAYITADRIRERRATLYEQFGQDLRTQQQCEYVEREIAFMLDAAGAMGPEAQRQTFDMTQRYRRGAGCDYEQMAADNALKQEL